MAVGEFFLELGRFGHELSEALRSAVTSTDLVDNNAVVVLFELALRGSRRPIDVQELTGLSSGGATKLIDRLEAAGAVSRRLGSVPGDRRGVLIELTSSGRRSVLSMIEALQIKLDESRLFLKHLSQLAETQD